jgi:hypothetical protein
MTERSYAKKNKLSYLEIKFDNNALGPDGEEHDFPRVFGKYERRVALSAKEAQIMFNRIEAAFAQLHALRRSEGRVPTKDERDPSDSTISMEAPVGKTFEEAP